MGPKNLSLSLSNVFLMEPTDNRLKLNYKAGLSFLYNMCVKCFAKVKVADSPFTFWLAERRVARYQVEVSANDDSHLCDHIVTAMPDTLTCTSVFLVIQKYHD